MPIDRFWTSAGPVFLLICLLIGGASVSGIVGTFVLEILAIGILAVLAWRGDPIAVARGWRWVAILFAGCLAAMVIWQFLPLPSELWRGLPGRGRAAELFDLAGVEIGWQMTSMAPIESLEGAAKLLVPVALFGVLASQKSRGAIEAGLWLVVLVSIISIPLGIAQMFSVSTSLLFYRITNYDAAVGFFANSNHLATLMLAGFLSACALLALARQRLKTDPGRGFWIFYCTLIALLAAGVFIVRSNAGYALFPVALVLGAMIVFNMRIPTSRPRLLGLGLALIASAVIWLGYGAAAETALGELPSGTDRPAITENTVRIAGEFAPVGSGLGTFREIYPISERLEVVTRYYINHAHNEYAQLWLELGVLGAILAALLIAAICMRGVETFRGRDSGDVLAQCGFAIAVICLLHSVVDYPLRTPAGAALFAFALAALFAGKSERLRPSRT